MNINDIITGIVLLAMLFTAEHILDTVFLPYYVLVVFGFMLLIKGFTDFTPEKIKKIQSNNQSDIQQTDFHPGIQPELPTNISTNTPNPNMKGVFRDGYEWIVWPENSGKHWYRSEGSIDGWSEYQS